MNGDLPATYCPGTMLNGKTIRLGGAIRMAPPLIANRGRSPGRQDGIPYAITGWHGTIGIMNIEVAVPNDWTPGQAMAVRQLLQHALSEAQPVIALIRKDATAEQLQDIYRRIQEVIREAGLEA